jgi:hypothetical protein
MAIPVMAEAILFDAEHWSFVVLFVCPSNNFLEGSGGNWRFYDNANLL